MPTRFCVTGRAWRKVASQRIGRGSKRLAPDQDLGQTMLYDFTRSILERISRRARHFIFFELVGSDRIDVIRILHDGMDFRAHLPDESSET